MSKATLHYRKNAGGGVWRLSFVDHARRRREVKLYPQKEPSETARAMIERIVSFRESGRPLDPEMLDWLDANGATRDKFTEWGIIDQRTAAAAEPVSILLERWERARELAGLGPQRCVPERRAAAMLEMCRCRTLAELTPDKARQCLATLESQDCGGRRGLETLSRQTVRDYLTALKTFVHWCIKEGYIGHDPLQTVTAKNPAKGDRTFLRRALTEEEIARLLAATEAGGKHHGLPGHARALVYRLALETGFRWNEIYTLERRDIDAKNGAVQVRAQNAKNAKTATNPISGELAAALTEHMASAPALPAARLFPGMWRDKGAAMIAEDCRAAGIEIENAQGVIDFHSLRHTLATRLARAGVSAMALQAVMRHACITTTNKHYTHALIEDKRAAVGAVALPTLAPATALTGTAGEGETAPAMACQGDEKRGQLYGQKMGEEWPKTANFDGGATGRAAVRKTGAGAIAGTTGKPGKTPLKPVSQWVEYWETSGAHNDFCHLGSAVEQCFRKA